MGKTLKTKLLLSSFLLLSALLFLFLPHAYSIIFNEGNEAVEIKISKKNGAEERTILYPNQSAGIPKNATQIQVARRQFARGDEFVKIKVDQENGTTRYITKAGESVILGAPVEETVTTTPYGTVTNSCNIPINFIVTYKNGQVDTIPIMPAQSLRFSPDAREVRVLSGSLTPLRGDETVKVSVVTPNGENIQINSVGVSARVDGAET